MFYVSFPFGANDSNHPTASEWSPDLIDFSTTKKKKNFLSYKARASNATVGKFIERRNHIINSNGLVHTSRELLSSFFFFFCLSEAYANSRDLRTWPEPVVKSFIKALPNKRRSAQKEATKQGKPWGTGRTICDVLMVNIRSIRRARECVRKINVFRGVRENGEQSVLFRGNVWIFGCSIDRRK